VIDRSELEALLATTRGRLCGELDLGPDQELDDLLDLADLAELVLDAHGWLQLGQAFGHVGPTWCAVHDTPDEVIAELDSGLERCRPAVLLVLESRGCTTT
jgi:hypothetical protein